MPDISFKSASALAADILAKRIGCVEALEHFWARVQRFNPQLNAIVVSDMDRARDRARAADAALARGEQWGPLHGVPFAAKDIIDSAGFPTCWGSPVYADRWPGRDASSIQLMKDAGVAPPGTMPMKQPTSAARSEVAQ